MTSLSTLPSVIWQQVRRFTETKTSLVTSLTSGRCEATVGNSPGEIEAVTAAARTFLKSEIEIQTLKNPSFEFQLTSAVSCYSQASKLQEDQGRPQLAGSLNMELAEALWRLRRPTEALPYYQRAADLFEKDILDYSLEFENNKLKKILTLLKVFKDSNKKLASFNLEKYGGKTFDKFAMKKIAF